LRDQWGSTVFAGKEHAAWIPWQKVWLDGLDKLGQHAEAAMDVSTGGKGETTKIFVVCHAATHLDGKSPFFGVFKLKYENKDMSPEHYEQWQLEEDFDPAYALEGAVATSVLDWERRHIMRAVTKFEGALEVKYIDECGVRYGGPPCWYHAESTATMAMRRSTNRRTSLVVTEQLSESRMHEIHQAFILFDRCGTTLSIE
jgi:hypothetical protein